MSLLMNFVLPDMFGDNWDIPVGHLGKYCSLEMLPEDFFTFPRHVWSKRRESGLSTVKNEPKQFSVSLDVGHFTPDEVTVKTVDNHLVIHGKHEEKADEHGFVSREFTRRYRLPDGVGADVVISSRNSEGTLTIQVPKVTPEEPPRNERIIPITMEETPAIPTVELPE